MPARSLSDRYGDLGSDTGDVLRTVVTQPVGGNPQGATADGGRYLLALLLPLLALSLVRAAARCGSPPGSRPQPAVQPARAAPHRIPLLGRDRAVPDRGGDRGLATLRARRRPGWVVRLVASPARVAAALVVAGIVAGYLLGPLPFWQHVPGGSKVRAEQYRVPARDGAPA